ncbi:uncharacterized protein LOC107268775 isoform X2 [Cephus cinctus]|uniref:Mediator of DNA damage checkpoint protein 1 n=1 Tax=Cephus cinctus TaxID=211228 RepID=A0AAJ7RJQ3_CEPCN|nr:uncharacterized protein LOC107268775 isoform X2 [Cephus cinctus]
MDIPATQVLDCPSDDISNEQVGILSVGSINYPVFLGANKIGRHPGCHIVINHNTVSKEHAEIDAGKENNTFICDLRSANRTVINNRCLRPGLFYQLNDGNVITMGQIKATYKVLDGNDDVLMENSIIPITPLSGNNKNKQKNIIPGTPDSSLNNSSTCENDDSVIPGTQLEKSNVFRLPSLPAQLISKNNTANVSADAVETVTGILLNDNDMAIDVRPSNSENEKDEVSIFDKETESYSQAHGNESQPTFDIHDAETQIFVVDGIRGEKAGKVNEEKIIDESTKSKSQEGTLNPSENSNSSSQNFLNISLPPSPVNSHVGENDGRSDTEGSIILIRVEDFYGPLSDKLNARDGNYKDRSDVTASAKVNSNLNVESNNCLNTDMYDAPTQCIDNEKSNITEKTMDDDSETDEEGIFEDYVDKKKSRHPKKSETKDDSETDEEGLFERFTQKDKGKDNSNAKESKNSSIEKPDNDNDIFDALTQKISTKEKKAITETNKLSNQSGSTDPPIVLEEDVDFFTAPTQIPPKDDQQVDIESQPTQILEVNDVESTEKASNVSSESTEHNIDYEMAPTQRIDDIVETSSKVASKKQRSPSRKKTYRRIKMPLTDSEDTEGTWNDNIETNLKSMFNESSNKDGGMEHCQMSSQTLLNVLESTQEAAIEKSPRRNPETKTKKSLRKKLETADNELNQKETEETKNVPTETDFKKENSRSRQSDRKSCGETLPERLTPWPKDEGTKKPGRRTAAKIKMNNRKLDKSIGKRDSPSSSMNRDEGEPYRIVKYSLGGSSSRQSSFSLNLDPEKPAGSKRKISAKVVAELSDDEMEFEEIKNIAERMLAVKSVYGSSNAVPSKKGTTRSVRKFDTVLHNKLPGRSLLSTDRQSCSLSVSVIGNNKKNSPCNKLDDERSSVFQVEKEAPLRTIVKAQERNSRAKTRSENTKTFDENDELQEVSSELGKKSARIGSRKENKNMKTKLIESKKEDEPGSESQEIDEIITKWSNTTGININEKEETSGRKCPSRKSKRSNVINTEIKNETTNDTNISIDSNDSSRKVIFGKPTKIPRRTRATKQSSTLPKSVIEPPKLTENITMSQTQPARTRRAKSATVERGLVDEKSPSDNNEKDISAVMDTSKESTIRTPKKGRGRARKRKLDEVEIENLADTSIDSSILNISTASVNKNNSSMLSLMSPSKRRQRILFTGVTQNDYRKIIQKLGGTITESPSTCTVLVTDKVRRTFKFLCVMARPVPIVSVEWLIESEKSGHFLDMENFILHDHSAELKFQFILRESLERAQAEKLLKDYDVLLTPNVAPPSIAEFKEILKNCGARPLLKPPTTWNKKTIVISREEDLANAKKFLSKAPKNVPLVSPEFILTGILRHEVNFDEHRLTLQ